MPLTIIRNDITELDSEAIVNAANSRLAEGGGVCGAIFEKAGRELMTAACARIAPCSVGGAVITAGFGLKAKFVIHAVGPVWRGGYQEEESLLRSAYRKSLQLASEHKLKSITFPLISAGNFGYPREKALAVALDEIQRFLMLHEMHVTLTLYDKNRMNLGYRPRQDLNCYLNAHYVEERRFRSERPGPGFNMPADSAILWDQKAEYSKSLPINFPEEVSFSQALLKLIDSKKMSDVTAYKRSNIDRKLFSKIRSNKSYNPTKRTVLAFTVGLGLSMEEAQDLLARAGYAFSPCSKRDVIVMWFLQNRNYDINQVNAALFDYDQELLGA